MSTVQYIRDHITVNQAFAARLAARSVGAGSRLVLAARSITHDAGYTLRLPGCAIVLLAQDYNANGGGIDVSGTNGSPGTAGAAGKDGALGEDGANGAVGTSGKPGTTAGSIQVLCETLAAARFAAIGGSGGAGGAGGNGGDGGAGRRMIPRKVEGIPPGIGGTGGNGGDGGAGQPGGRIDVHYVSASAAPPVANAGGSGAPGGAGGTGGRRGRLFGNVGFPGRASASGMAGKHGSTGVAGTTSVGTVTADGYWRLVAAALGGTASAWADARLASGEFFYRRANVPVSGGPGHLALATGEFSRVLRLRGSDPGARRFAAQIAADQNALGLANRLDITPAFQQYADAYAAWGPTVFGTFDGAIRFLLAGVVDDAWRGQLGQHLGELGSGVVTATAELDAANAGAAAAQQGLANAQDKVDALTQQVNAAKAAMDDESVGIGGIIGTVLEVASAVVAVIAAIPTAGTSLVALVPAFITLSSNIYNDAGAIVGQLFTDGGIPQEVKDAYDKAGKDIKDIVKAGQAIVSLVQAINKLDAAKTAQNAKYVDLVKQALQAGHELLLAQHLMAQADLQVTACQVKVDQGKVLVDQATALLATTNANRSTLVDAARILIGAAEGRRDTLLRYAFMAQRAVEIYTGRDESAAVRLDAGYVDPDILADFAEGFLPLAQLAQAYAQAWERFTSPIELETDYLDYFSGMTGHLDVGWQRFDFHDPETIDRFKATRSLDFDLLLGSIPARHYEAKVHSVAVSLVGAASPSGVSTCELRHGPVYEQTRRDGTMDTQILRPHVGTIQSPHTALADSGVVVGNGTDPIEEPLLSPLWGRGIAGQWQLDLAAAETGSTDLSGLSRIEVWIANEFYSPSA